MVKEPKITIKIFLQDNLKPTIGDNGEELFTIYARVIFLRRGTHLPILNQVGKQIQMTRENFEYLMDPCRKWAIEGHFTFTSTERVIFSKELLLYKTIQRVYAKEKEGVDFKDLVKLYRWYERFVYVVVYDKAKEISGKLIGEADKKPVDFSEDNRRGMEALVAVLSYFGHTTNRKTYRIKEGIIGMPSSTWGTVFHWLFEGGKHEFKEYLTQHLGDAKNFEEWANNWGVSREFIKLFPPSPEYIDSYVEAVSLMIEELEPEKELT